MNKDNNTKSSDNKKIDIKDYLKGENKKKMIPFVFIGLVVLAMIYYAMGSSDSETTDELTSPDREVENYNSKLDAQGNKKEDAQVNNLGYFQEQPQDYATENVEEFDPNAINQALSNVGNSTGNQNNSTHSDYNEPSSSYNPYGSRDMYTIPERKAPNYSYKQQQQTYDYPTEPSYTPPVQSNNNVQTSSTKNSKVWKNQRYSSQSTAPTGGQRESAKVYKASIVSSRQKYLTPDNNRVQIRVMEPFSVNGVNVPRTTQLIAYAQFDKELRLEIKSIMINNKQIPVSISVLDSQGQEAIEIVGGTGAEISQEGQDEIISNTRTGNGIVDKAVNIFSGKKKPKALVSSDFVYLRIN